MAVIHPRISHGSRRAAKAVIGSMRVVLQQRHRGERTRGQFLRSWSALRRELRATYEYARFVEEVRERAGGLCESCGDPGCLVHHIKPVVYHLRLALVADNGKYLCTTCHETEDKWLSTKQNRKLVSANSGKGRL